MLNRPPQTIVWKLLLISIFISGCVQQGHLTNVSRLDLVGDPRVTNLLDPDAKFENYRSFSTIPYSDMMGNSPLNTIEERQILFFIRNLLEGKGYKYVSTLDSSDFIVTANSINPYREHYVEPENVQVFEWVPSKTTSQTTSTKGKLTLGTNGDPWGGYEEKSTTETDIPGHLETATKVRSGYTLGSYYPQFTLYVYDKKSHKNIYQSTANGVSSTSDIRITCQYLGIRSVANVPPCPIDLTLAQAPSGFLGCLFISLTTDGNYYWPTVMKVVPGSEADNVGMEFGDIIMSIDAIGLKNRTIVDFLRLLRGDIGTKRHLSVWRMGEKLEFDVTLAARKD